MADRWRRVGLEVDLVEYLGTSTEPGGYTISARSNSSVMSCRCQAWRVRRLLGRRRGLWTITVSVRPALQDPTAAPVPPQVVVVASWEHDRAWEKVQGWIDEGTELPRTLDGALASID
ncbi:MAG: hypothetical protein U1E52_11830 [Geminicoccaceae bacterium]